MDLRGNSYPTRIELCGNALHHADTLKNGFVSFLGVEPNSLLYPCCKHGEKRMIRCRAHMLPDKNGGLLPAHQITDIIGTPVVRPAPLRNLKIGTATENRTPINEMKTHCTNRYTIAAKLIF